MDQACGMGAPAIVEAHEQHARSVPFQHTVAERAQAIEVAVSVTAQGCSGDEAVDSAEGGFRETAGPFGGVRSA